MIGESKPELPNLLKAVLEVLTIGDLRELKFLLLAPSFPPFTESSPLPLNCSWSPDGSKILAPNAMSGPIFTARLIERSSWKADQNLVGHENSVLVAAYSPKAFKAGPGALGNITTVFALGSQDQSVSVWQEGRGEPVLVAKDLFERGVMDLSW